MTIAEVFKALIPLFLIVGLLYGVLWFVKKYGVSAGGKGKAKIPVNVLSSQMIMPKKFISIVEIQNRLLVLGVSENSITLLKELDGPAETINTNSTAINGEDKNNFLDLLKKNLGMR
jgi:flagellar protein FliO/FliZ